MFRTCPVEKNKRLYVSRYFAVSFTAFDTITTADGMCTFSELDTQQSTVNFQMCKRTAYCYIYDGGFAEQDVAPC
jgi:hypothetical protein